MLVGLWTSRPADAVSRKSHFVISGIGKDPFTNTKIIQRWIDSCSSSGGGLVQFPQGEVLSGTLFLKTGVILFFQKGCVLKGDTNLSLFPKQESVHTWHKGTEGHHQRALLVAMGQKDIGITGEGTIDGQGEIVYKAWYSKRLEARWLNIWFQDCKDVFVERVTMLNSPSWMQLYQRCQNLSIDGIQVVNFGAKNNDGLDLDGCKNVTINECRIDADDDALCIKSLGLAEMTNIRITNCILSSNCNALKVGTETEGDISNVRARNIKIIKPSQPSVFYKRQEALSGIAVTMVDGGNLSHVDFSDIQIEGVKIPFFIRQGTRNRRSTGPKNTPSNSTICNIRFSNIKANWNFDLACHITAVDSGAISNLKFSNIELNYAPVAENSIGPNRSPLPEVNGAYPEATMFKKGLPEVVLFAKGVSGFSLKNVDFRENVRRTSGLPAFYSLHCSGIKVR